jgi:hypothetical protein
VPLDPRTAPQEKREDEKKRDKKQQAGAKGFHDARGNRVV